MEIHRKAAPHSQAEAKEPKESEIQKAGLLELIRRSHPDCRAVEGSDPGALADRGSLRKNQARPPFIPPMVLPLASERVPLEALTVPEALVLEV